MADEADIYLILKASAFHIHRCPYQFQVAGLFFRFSTPNSDAILALTQAYFRPKSANFFS